VSEKLEVNPRFNTALLGLLGGFIGAIIMGLIAYVTPPPNTGGNPFFIAAARAMGFGDTAWVAGWLIQVLVGMVIGIIFGVAIRRTPRTKREGDLLLRAVVAGLVAWGVLFLPLLGLLHSLTISTAGSGVVLNILFAVIMVIVFGLAQSVLLTEREIVVFRCDVCNARFETGDELEEHRRRQHPQLEPAVSEPEHA
jgi:hypothetical protein